MKFTNSFLVSCRVISFNTPNPEMVLETMKRSMFWTKKLLHGRYVLDLFSNLCRKKIGTNTMVNQCRRVCSGLQEKRERQLIGRVMNWRRMDAISELRVCRRENTKVWREAKRILTAHNICNDYLIVWNQEREAYRVHLRQLLNSKLMTLTRRYSKKEETPDTIRGITVKDQKVPDTFSTEPQCYGGVDLSAEERSALSLPPKFYCLFQG